MKVLVEAGGFMVLGMILGVPFGRIGLGTILGLVFGLLFAGALALARSRLRPDGPSH